MSNEVSIFSSGLPATQSQRPLSALTQSIDTGPSLRRIQTNTNGTFRRLIGGEQVGRAISGAFNAIIVGMLPKVSRSYYAAAYDPNAKPTLPDCWSNLGDAPEANVPNRQAAACSACPNNIDGSGDNGRGRACRFQRRLAILLEGDKTGEVYQINIPAKSLFGKGQGNTHPFESYVKFLVANQFSVDYVVTTIAYNTEADTMELNFTPFREINDAEYELVVKAQEDPETAKYTQLVVAQVDGVTAKPRQPTAPTPTPAPARNPTVQSFADDTDTDVEEPAPTPAPTPAPATNGSVFDDAPPAEEPAPAPTTRRRKSKAETPADPPQPVSNTLANVIDSWATPNG